MFEDLSPGDVAIVREKGRFRQCQLAKWNGQLFAKIGGTYVRLTATGGTSVPSIGLEQLTFDGPLFKDRFGRLCVEAGPQRTELSGPDATLLIAGKYAE